MRNFLMLLLLLTLQRQAEATHFGCLLTLCGIAGMPFEEEQALVISAYRNLWSDLGNELPPDILKKIADSGNPFKIPEGIQLKSSSFSDSLTQMAETIDASANGPKFRLAILEDLKKLSQSVQQSKESQRNQDERTRDVRVNWKPQIMRLTSSWDGKVMGGYGYVGKGNSQFRFFDRTNKNVQKVSWMDQSHYFPAVISPSGGFVLAGVNYSLTLAKFPIKNGKLESDGKLNFSENLKKNRALHLLAITPDEHWAIGFTQGDLKLVRYDLTTGIGDFLLPGNSVHSLKVNPFSGKVAVLAETGAELQIFYEKPDGDFKEPVFTKDSALSNKNAWGISPDGKKLYLEEKNPGDTPKLLEIALNSKKKKSRSIDLKLPGSANEHWVEPRDVVVAPDGTLYVLVHVGVDDYDSVRKVEFFSSKVAVSEIYRGEDNGGTSIQVVEGTLLVHSPYRGTYLYPFP